MADEDKKAAQYRKEAAAAQSPVPTPAERAKMMEEKKQADIEKAEKAAPTTRTEMNKIFKKGGYVSAADGCVQRGKTRGRMV